MPGPTRAQIRQFIENTGANPTFTFAYASDASLLPGDASRIVEYQQTLSQMAAPMGVSPDLLAAYVSAIGNRPDSLPRLSQWLAAERLNVNSILPAGYKYRHDLGTVTTTPPADDADNGFEKAIDDFKKWWEENDTNKVIVVGGAIAAYLLLAGGGRRRLF